jgi:hypothetical protein
MHGPSQYKSQPKPKINVKLEAGDGTLMQLRKGYNCYEEEEPEHEKAHPAVANHIAYDNNDCSLPGSVNVKNLKM